MAGGDINKSSRRKHKHSSSARKSHKAHEKHETASPSAAASIRPQTLDALRKARLEYIEKPVEERARTMKYVYDAPVAVKSRNSKDDKRERQSVVSVTRRKSVEPRKRRKRKDPEERDAQSDDGYVYGKPEEGEKRVQTTSSRSREHLAPKATSKRSTASKATERRGTPKRRNTEPLQRRNSCPEEDSVITVTPPSRRRIAQDAPRPSLKRSATTIDASTEVSTTKSTATSPSKRRDSSLFSGLLLSTPNRPVERKTSCLTCGSDDVPIPKTARLPCKHRMCHTCLKRIFKLSLTDPAHMPPRCCTSDHIDLKHVDKLFSQEFKRTWNRKFLEFQTKNKIYCIGKGCGEWIKPNHVTIEHGRKIGKCKKCGTRVCAICNNRAHTSRDCPKDPATKEFIETAKQKGWQKCYSCSAMVELKEGCNHMTCRCTAEFCMVCGLKWKSCDCPWFNYENMDAHLGNPVRYQEEMDRRRDQERRDEALARRMQDLGVTDGAARGNREREVWGIGNAAGHHMNANFIQQAREVFTANYANAEQAARGLLNGWMTGRENPLPGFPGGLDEINAFLRQPNAAANGGDQNGVDAAPRAPPENMVRPARRATTRRRGALVDMLTTAGGRSQTAEEAEQDNRIRDWANNVRPT